MSQNPSTTFPATVEKIIKPLVGPEKAQLAIHDGEELYKEIRIENTLTDENGEEVRLKEGAQVEVKVEADAKAVTPKS